MLSKGSDVRPESLSCLLQSPTSDRLVEGLLPRLDLIGLGMASFGGQRSPPDNGELRRAVFPAGPQPRVRNMLDRLPESMSEYMPDRLPESMSEEKPERMPEDMPEIMSEYVR